MVNINEIFEDRGEGLDGEDSWRNEDNDDMGEIRNLMGETGIAEVNFLGGFCYYFLPQFVFKNDFLVGSRHSKGFFRR